MSNIVVNSATSFLNSSAVVRVNSTSETGAESFDETLKGLKRNDGTTQHDRAEVNRPDGKSADDAATKKLTSTGKRDVVKQDEEPDDEQIAAISEEIVSQIKAVIQEQFGISEEELSSVMNSLGISDENLLETDSLTKLVMKLDGIENQSDVLTNPDFAADLKELMTEVKQIRENVPAEAVDAKDLSETETESIGKELQTDVELPDNTTVAESEADNTVDVENEEPTEQIADAKITMNSEETGGAETGKDQLNDMIKHDGGKNDTVADNDALNNQTIQPQDFAAKLTEDLAGRVGEEQATDIVRQVVEQVQLQTKQGITSMEMQIYPEHLGKVLIQVVSKDGFVTAQITAETEAAKNALESQLTLLKENLNNQGVKIENVEVTIASHAFEQNMQGEREQEQNAGNGSRGKRAAKLLNESFIDELKDEPEVMEVRGNTVSYSA